jgi:magnesium-transporting ATPase (P-type)
MAMIEKYKSTQTSTSADGLALSSDMLGRLTDDEIKILVSGIRVIARALPTDKSRMVKVCQSMNLVVGMTGDGVNDSPALKRADIGFAMGSGTAVAKEAGDLVILDDNFKSIKDAIWFGRTIYMNILKFCRMQLVINVGAVLISMICPLIGIEEPLKVTHLLWVNLVMDSLASIMMAGEPALEKYLHMKPRRRDESIISKPMASHILTMSLWLTVLGIVYFKVPLIRDMFANDAQWMTGYFCLFIFASLMNALNIRSEGFNLFDHIQENPTYIKIWFVIMAVQVILAMSSLIPGVGVVANMFSCEAFGIKGWLIVLLMSATMIPIESLRKLITGSYKNV